MKILLRMALLLLLGASAAGDSSGPTGPAVLSGTVRVVDPPRRRKIRMDVDPLVEAMHTEPVFSDDIVVDAQNRVQWAFVSVKSGLKDKTFPVPQEARLMVHDKGMSKPHVLGIQAGQPLRIRNEDGILHNNHGLSIANPEFNFGQHEKGTEVVKSFPKPEDFFKIKCDIHPWQRVWVRVMPHPFYAVTGPDGRFEIKGLPPGEYIVEAWQERYKPVVTKVKARIGSRLNVDFTLAEKQP